MVTWNGPKVGRQALYIFFGDVLRDVGSACLEPHKTCLLILRMEVAQPRVRLQSISTHTVVPGLDLRRNLTRPASPRRQSKGLEEACQLGLGFRV